MSTFVESIKNPDRLRVFGCGAALLLAIAAVSIPNLNRSRVASEEASKIAAYDAAMQLRDRDALSESLVNRSPASLPVSDQAATADRKIVRTIALEMTVSNPIESAERVQAFAAGLGGYVESSQVRTQGTPSANLTIRVPAAKLEEAKAGLRKLAVQVDNEKTDAEDVTRQYVDDEARLRNLRAEEAQYLTIMKSAIKVQDMLDVSEKLSGVRGEIEQQQAEFAALSKQVETIAITIALHAQVDTDVLGFHWRPLYQLKVAVHDALDGLANYAGTMVSFILYLPLILLWAVTILVGAVISWRILRWAGRAVFGWTPTVGSHSLSV